MSKTILVFISFYLPGYKSGGPAQSIVNMVDFLGDEFDFRIITSDHDLGDKVPFSGIRTGIWIQVGKAKVMYLAPEHLGLFAIAKLLRKTRYDLLYLNSFLDPQFTGIPLLARLLDVIPRNPVVLAPRGEFSIGALALKRSKKLVYIAISKMIGLYKNINWHASTKYEANDIRRTMGSVSADIHIASDLPRLMDTFLSSQPKHTRLPNTPLQVVFLSRISPKKNLHFALQILAQVRVPIEFSIYGPKEDTSYWQLCEKAIHGIPPHVHAEYRGAVAPNQIIETLLQQDLFFFPTLGENYGHVIAEAFQAGLPVLVSDQTPWRNLDKEGVGLDCALDNQQCFVDYIEKVAGMNSEEMNALKERVTQYAKTIMNVTDKVEQNRTMFLHAASRINSQIGNE